MLECVTITGADDRSNVQQLVDLSAEFPFVEWGILVSIRNEGHYRFPSRDWIEQFSVATASCKIRKSMHVCGKWVRQMFLGELDWRDLPMIEQTCQRVQINTHAERHLVTNGLLTSLHLAATKEFIFQWDGVNNLHVYAPLAYGLKVSALFDTSGGAGILPEDWPVPSSEFRCGYAGGLGPDNVVEQIERIEKVCHKPFWIDMERRVRTEDDSALDFAKVREVLEKCRRAMEGKDA